MKTQFHSCLFALVLFPVASFGQITEAKLTATDGVPLDNFGNSVSLSSDYALIGAFNGGPSAGSAYVFHFDGSNWIEQTKFRVGDPAAGDNFGSSVSLSGDYALIGASGDDDRGSNSGSAYIFHFDGSGWVEETKLIASDGAMDDLFGGSVSLSGDYALIGANGDDDNGTNSGSAYIFHFDGSNWVEEAKLTASDGAMDDLFGGSVSLSGDHALIGARYDDDNQVSSGSAYIFHSNGSNWVEESKLTPRDGAAYEYFGNSVSLSGDYALIGAYYGRRNGVTSGTAYIFHFDGSNWVQEAKLASDDGWWDDYFGWSVSLAGDYALIGSYLDDDNGAQSGSAYVYSGFSTISMVSAEVTLSPSSGDGTFDYYLDFTNLTAGPLTVDIWTEMSGPGGRTKVGSVATDRTLEANRSYSESGTATLDGGTPVGDYVFTVKVGEYPDVVTASGSASYTKTSLGKDDISSSTGPVPTSFELFQNHPNPFNPTTTFSFTIPQSSIVNLTVYDLLGREVATLVNENLHVGSYEATFGASRLATGVYFYRLRAGNFVAMRRMIIVK